jgi:hypothetical protein
MVVAIVVVVLVLVLVAAIVPGQRRKAADRRVDNVYEAATSGQGEQLRQWVDQGHSLDARDREGNTALHHAYYDGQQDAIAALIAYGATDNLRNKEGLSPAEMATLAAVEDQLAMGVQYLAGDGTWSDRERGRAVYDELRRVAGRIYRPALVRSVLSTTDRRKLLHLAIKLGMAGSQERLVQVLNGYGTREMALDYLNAGSDVLRQGAEQWARRHNYHVYYTGGRSAVTWGSF